MFLALRDLRFARGRFALITTLVTLMTLLVGFLTGLTGGLAMQNISGLLGTKATSVVFDVPDGETAEFSLSKISEEQATTWSEGTQGAVTPLGVGTAVLSSARTGSEDKETVTIFAAPPASGITEIPGDNEITLGAQTAEALGVGASGTVVMGGTRLTVARIVEDKQYSHMPIAWVTLGTWHNFQASTHQPQTYANVLLLGIQGQQPDARAIENLNAATGTVTQGFPSSLLAAGAFRSEIGSLAMMIGMLVVISALVIGVFFLVWSMQRQRDIAVLKALGASTRWLARDALGQAILVLAVGAGIGIAVTAGLGMLAMKVMPFMMNPWTLVIPPILMLLAGVVGALVSLRTITRVDPNSALQATVA